jgi:hypothetical protein
MHDRPGLLDQKVTGTASRSAAVERTLTIKRGIVMKKIHEFLQDLGAISPTTAITTDKIIRAVQSEPIPMDEWGKSRLVYTELVRSNRVIRIDIEADLEPVANGWYVTQNR